MAITYTWNVNTMDTAPSENELTDVVKVVHWRLAATDGTYIADTFSTLPLESPDSENFTAFADLTEAQVISWVESKLNVDAIKLNLNQRLEMIANPPVVTKQGPWIPSPTMSPQPLPAEE